MTAFITRLPVALGVFLLGATAARAEQITFRFVPNACGQMTQVPAGPNGSIGERRVGLGFYAEAYPFTVTPNQMVTFRHPFTGCNVTVPLRLPPGEPRIQHRSDRIVYNYGSYVVEARFFPDGSVDAVYNSGLLRPVQFE